MSGKCITQSCRNINGAADLVPSLLNSTWHPSVSVAPSQLFGWDGITYHLSLVRATGPWHFHVAEGRVPTSSQEGGMSWGAALSPPSWHERVQKKE